MFAGAPAANSREAIRMFAGAPASNSREAIRKVDFNINIRNFMANVKWENSGQEKYTAESGLEGKTAFMAAYEAARTEKANRQNEPQYSLTQATEGRKMSSRARRDVNQTMNAVQTELRGLIEAETRAARDTDTRRAKEQSSRSRRREHGVRGRWGEL